MKKTHSLTTIYLLLLSFFAFSQEKEIKGTLETTKLVNVEVMNLKPQGKNKVNMIFRAETLEGEPAWDLKKEDLIVKEGNDTCEILEVEPISQNKPISVALAIDHSGSMASEWDLWTLVNFIRGKEDSVPSPLERAKTSAEEFVSTFNLKKDKISIVGFGSMVDIKVPLTQDTARLNTTIRNIEINGSTALYDAMIAGMKQIRKQKGTKVLVALTDGHENASKASWQNVVDYSKRYNVPVYIVGLGSVDSDTLKAMTDSTKGQFYHTEKSSSLSDIYAKISQSIQSFYALKYVSKNAKKAREEDIKISFDINSIYLANDPTDPDVIAYLEKQKFDAQVKYYGKIAVYVLIGAGVISLLYIRRRRRKLRKLKKKEKDN